MWRNTLAWPFSRSISYDDDRIISMHPSSSFVAGKLYGGIAVMWRNTLARPFSRSISYDDDRIIGLEHNQNEVTNLYCSWGHACHIVCIRILTEMSFIWLN